MTATTTTPASTSSRPVSTRKPRNWGKHLELTLLLAPALVLFIAFVLLPIAVAVYYSFFKWTGFSPRHPYGLGNYAWALHDTVFRHSVWKTVEFLVRPGEQVRKQECTVRTGSMPQSSRG